MIGLSKTGPTLIETTPHIQLRPSDAKNGETITDSAVTQKVWITNHTNQMQHIGMKHDYAAYKPTQVILSNDVKI